MRKQVKKQRKKKSKYRYSKFIRPVILLLLDCALISQWPEAEEGVQVNAKSNLAESKASKSETENTTEPYTLKFEDPDEGEFYRHKPEIRLQHWDSKYRTCYEFQDADGNKTEGSLTDPEEIYQVEKSALTEGKNVLKVWLEKRTEQKIPEENMGKEDTGEEETEEKKGESLDVEETEGDQGVEEDGESSDVEETTWELVEDSERKYYFRIDTEKPTMGKIQYASQTGSRPYCYDGDTTMILTAKDEGFGVKAICYTISGQESRTVVGERTEIHLPSGFRGNVRAYCVDLAGNIGESVTTEEILCDGNMPEIRLTAPKGFESWYQEEAFVQLEIKDPGVSSGLAEVRCHVNGKLILQEQWPYEQEITRYYTKVAVKEASERGGKVPITVEVRDHAGNQVTESSSLYMDGVKPLIQILNIQDRQITGEPLLLQLEVEEENILQEVSAGLMRESVDGKKENVIASGWEKTEFGSRFVQELREDGRYYLTVKARDAAGNQNQTEIEFTIDQTNPIIRYVDQLQGSYLKYFQWNYQQEEFVQDMTDYTYQMQLNGAPYLPGTKIELEGKKNLCVWAKDAAGNISRAEADFVIDHTEPVILFGDIVSGKIYEKEAMLMVSTKDDADSITSISINGEEQKLTPGSKAFRFPIQTPGTYIVDVTAKDLARNTARSVIQFQVVEQKNFLQKLWEPTPDVTNKSSGLAMGTKEEDHFVAEKIWVIGGFVLMGSGLLYFGRGHILQRKKIEQ